MKNSLKKINPLMTLVFTIGFTSVSSAEITVFIPTQPQFSTSLKQREQNNQLYALGQAIFNNGVKLPMYAVTAESPTDEGLLKQFAPCTGKNCFFEFNLEPKFAPKLKVLAIHGIGAVLVPKDWQDIQSAVGANGTASSLIMSPDKQQSITLYNSSACVGCGMRPATLYFPELLPQSIENEFYGQYDKHRYLSIVRPSPHVAFFSYQIPTLLGKTHGVAKYDDSDTFNFQNIHLTLKPNEADLARTILNFYHRFH